MDYQEAIKVLHYATLSGGHPKDLCDMKAVATLAMQELQEYKKIGTLEEVQDAVERQQEKQVINISKGKELRFDTCPICNRRISNVEGGNYCQNCGQKLNWEGTEE